MVAEPVPELPPELPFTVTYANPDALGGGASWPTHAPLARLKVSGTVRSVPERVSSSALKLPALTAEAPLVILASTDRTDPGRTSEGGRPFSVTVTFTPRELADAPSRP